MANFQCPAGTICSAPMTTRVGASQDTPVEHITVTYLTQGADNKVDGGWTFVHEKQNGEWNTVAVSRDGGENWAFREDKGAEIYIKSTLNK